VASRPSLVRLWNQRARAWCRRVHVSQCPVWPGGHDGAVAAASSRLTCGTVSGISPGSAGGDWPGRTGGAACVSVRSRSRAAVTAQIARAAQVPLPVVAMSYLAGTPSRMSLGSLKHLNPAVSCRPRMPPGSAFASLRQGQARGRPSSSLTGDRRVRRRPCERKRQRSHMYHRIDPNPPSAVFRFVAEARQDLPVLLASARQ
jgi:hypothetical protein